MIKINSLLDELSPIISPPSHIQKTLHALLNVGGFWCWARLNRFMTCQRWSETPNVLFHD